MMSKTSSSSETFTVVDLFSGAGGASFGFHAHPAFRVRAAVDAQNGKPSSGAGTLECNSTYEHNIGVAPLEADIGRMSRAELLGYLASCRIESVDVLISCAPCTGFSRTIRRNLVQDDPRNTLVAKTAQIVSWVKPKVLLMENVGELIEGRFSHHYKSLRKTLEDEGFSVHGAVHWLDKFGLPQGRRRALVLAVKQPLTMRTLDDLWDGYSVRPAATHVRRAIAHLPPVAAGQRHPSDPMHVSPSMTPAGLERLRLIPPDGGSWPDLLRVPGGKDYLIPSMKRYADQGRVGPHPDVYGRLAWDQPAVTLKRECGHTGNGRYAHPEQNRHCTVREMAILQGFPAKYQFIAGSLSNMYRHIGDAVPPLISHQLAWLCLWILTGTRPKVERVLLPGTHLCAGDVVESRAKQLHLTGMAM